MSSLSTAHLERPTGWGAILRPIRWALRVGVLAGFVVAALQIGTAAASDGFYTVEVDVSSRQEGERQRALEGGLRRILARMTGAFGDALDDHPATDLIADAEGYLSGYRYIRVADDGLAIELRFDGAALRSALGEREIAVWGGVRAPVLVWLAIDVGGQRSFLSVDDSDAEVARAVREHAHERALPLRSPLLDLEDRQGLRFVDLWAGFEEQIRGASNRYGGAAVVAAALRQTARGGWVGRWTVLMGEESLSHQGGPGPLDDVVGRGLDVVGRALARRYATVSGEQEGRRIEIAVFGVERVAAYLDLISHLEGVDGVTRVDVRRAATEGLVLQLGLERNPQRVLEVLDASPPLLVEPLSTVDLGHGSGQVVRTYRWLPDRP